MILSLLQRRYSCRDFDSRSIPDDVIAYMLECARLSPSGGNEQPWRFGVITDPKLIGQIAQAAGVNYPQPWIATAPLLMALCTQIFEEGEIGMRRFPAYHDKLQSMDRELFTIIGMEEHQVKIAGTHMILAALEHGVYSTWISSVDCERVGELLGVEGYLVTNVIAFGYPKAHRAVTPKKDLKTISFTNHFQDMGFHGSCD